MGIKQMWTMKSVRIQRHFIIICACVVSLLLMLSQHFQHYGEPTIYTQESPDAFIIHEDMPKETLIPKSEIQPNESSTSHDAPDVLGSTTQDRQQKLNVLFLVSDDLRPQINSYRGPHHANPNIPSPAYTPNLDKLAKKSIQMNRAYVQFPVCGPSRASYMTSRRPDTTWIWEISTYWRDAGGNFTTIPQYFKENGYRTAGFGKVYHPLPGEAGRDPLSWTEPYGTAKKGTRYQNVDQSWWAVPKNETDLVPMPDEQFTDGAIKMLKKLAPEARSGNTPFFLAVGFKKPHIPFAFPERYLNIYNMEEVKLVSNDRRILNFPDIAYDLTRSFEPGLYSDISSMGLHGFLNETMPDRQSRELRRAYFSCMSFIDDMVGRILETLDELGLAQNTIVTFIGDHGYHLGENAIWGKHTNLEQSTHAPMMIHIPGLTDHSIQTDSLVEFVDLFPTLAEAAGLEAVPPCPPVSRDIELCTEGVSLMPLVRDPTTVIKTKVISQIFRGIPFYLMGYAIRTDRYRYVEWAPMDQKVISFNVCIYTIKWDQLEASELYDHEVDHEENVNRVGDPAYKKVVNRISRELRDTVGKYITGTCLLK